jgi:sigma-E factor negative regulatory protein RseC
VLEETAQVVSVEEGHVWVETRRRSTCSSCSVEAGCGVAALSKALGKRRNVLRVIARMPLNVGDLVVIGIREQALVKGSLAVYAVPLLLLMVGALLGELGARQFLWDNAETASALLGIAGLAAGLVWLKKFTWRIRKDENYQPVVLRRATIPPSGVAGLE